jgi:hypothetical protein
LAYGQGERLAVRQASFSGMDFQEKSLKQEPRSDYVPKVKSTSLLINHNQIYIVCRVCAEIAMCGFQENPSIRSQYTAEKVLCSPNIVPCIIHRSQPYLQRFVGLAQNELSVDFQEDPSNES